MKRKAAKVDNRGELDFVDFGSRKDFTISPALLDVLKQNTQRRQELVKANGAYNPLGLKFDKHMNPLR